MAVYVDQPMWFCESVLIDVCRDAIRRLESGHMSKVRVLHIVSGMQAGLSAGDANAVHTDLVSRRLSRRAVKYGAEAMPNWRPTYVTTSGAQTNIAGFPPWRRGGDGAP